MPNQFIRRPANLSRRDMADREPLEPRMEYVEGDNLPYRGYAYHGVEPTERPMEPDGYADMVEMKTDELPEEVQAVPVRIVDTTGGRRRVIFRCDSQIVPAVTPVRMAARDETRVTLRITNINAFHTAYFGPTQNISDVAGGFPMSTNVIHEIKASREEVWVYIPDPAATNVRIAFYAEYEIPLDNP